LAEVGSSNRLLGGRAALRPQPISALRNTQCVQRERLRTCLWTSRANSAAGRAKITLMRFHTANTSSDCYGPASHRAGESISLPLDDPDSEKSSGRVRLIGGGPTALQSFVRPLERPPQTRVAQARRMLQSTWTPTFPGLWLKRLILSQHLERPGPQKKLLSLETEGRPPSWHQKMCRRSRRTEEPPENVSRELSLLSASYSSAPDASQRRLLGHQRSVFV